jgi:hypothetical protein
MRVLLCLATLLMLAPPAWADRRDEIRASLAAARRANARRASLNRVYYYWKLRTGQIGSSVTEKNQKKCKTKIVVKHRARRRNRQVKPRKVVKRRAHSRRVVRKPPRKKLRSVLGAVSAGLQVDDPADIPMPAEPGAGKKQEQDDGKPKKAKVHRKKPEPKTDDPDQLKRMPIGS